MTVYLPNGKRGLLVTSGGWIWLQVPGRKAVKLGRVGSASVAQWIARHTR
jgi:hypothetical protein